MTATQVVYYLTADKRQAAVTALYMGLVSLGDMDAKLIEPGGPVYDIGQKAHARAFQPESLASYGKKGKAPPIHVEVGPTAFDKVTILNIAKRREMAAAEEKKTEGLDAWGAHWSVPKLKTVSPKKEAEEKIKAVLDWNATAALPFLHSVLMHEYYHVLQFQDKSVATFSPPALEVQAYCRQIIISKETGMFDRPKDMEDVWSRHAYVEMNNLRTRPNSKSEIPVKEQIAHLAPLYKRAFYMASEATASLAMRLPY